MLPPVPPWAAGNTFEPVSLDVGNNVDVTPYVRFEANHSDINYGVLDIQVCFMHERSKTNVYFALAENYDKNGTLPQGWNDNFPLPSALTKMIVHYQGRTINVCVQNCLADYRSPTSHMVLGETTRCVPANNRMLGSARPALGSLHWDL